MNRTLAEEMLELLINDIPAEFLEIKNAYKANDFTLLLQRLHKLHGAVSYCNVPTLKRTITKLETALKTKQSSEVPQLFEEFEQTIATLLEQAS